MSIQLFAIIWSALFSLHPLHVSVTEIELDEKEHELEITMRIFADDLETALRTEFRQPTLDVLDPNNKESLNQMTDAYLKKHFYVKLDGKLQTATLIGHELDNDAFVFYVGISKVKKWKTIEIRNTALTEAFEDQSNLVHVTVGEEVKSLRLMRDTPSDKLTFDLK